MQQGLRAHFFGARTNSNTDISIIAALSLQYCFGFSIAITNSGAQPLLCSEKFVVNPKPKTFNRKSLLF